MVMVNERFFVEKGSEIEKTGITKRFESLSLILDISGNYTSLLNHLTIHTKTAKIDITTICLQFFSCSW